MWTLLLLNPAAAGEQACPPDTGSAERSVEGATWRGCVRADGVWHGPVEIRNPDGTVWAGAFFEGAQHGPWTQRSPEGERLAAGQFDKGIRKGEWLTWDRSGALVGKVESDRAADEAPVGGEESSTSRIEAVGDLLAVATDKRLTVFDADLEVLWTTALGSGLSDLDLWTDGVVVLESDGTLVDIDLERGEVGRVRTGEAQGWVVGAYGDLVVVRDRRGQLSCWDTTTGQRRWRSDSFMNPARGAVSGRGVLTTRARKLVRTNVETGEEDWVVATPGLAADLVVGDEVIVLDHEGAVTAFEPATGRQLWRSEGVLEAGDVRQGSLRLDADEIVVRGRWEVVVLDADGIELRSFAVPKETIGMPDASGSRMAVRTREGTLLVRGPGEVADEYEVDLEEVQAFRVDPFDIVVRTQSATEILDPADFELPGQVVGPRQAGWAVAETVTTWVDGEEYALPVAVRRDAGQVLWIDAGAVPEGAELEVALSWQESPADPVIVPDEIWEITEQPGRFELVGLHPWTPRVARAWPQERWDGHEEFFDKLLHCEVPASRFDGTLELDDGVRSLVLEGSIDVIPEVSQLESGGNCLLHVRSAGQHHGVFSPPDEDSVAGIVIEAAGVVQQDARTLVGPPGAWAQVDYLLPWQASGVVHQVTGPFVLTLGEAGLSIEGQAPLQLQTGALVFPDHTEEGPAWRITRSWTGTTVLDDPGWVAIGVLPEPE